MENKTTYAQEGDVITFLENGCAKLAYGSGTKAETRLVLAREIIQADRPISISEVPVHVTERETPRTVVKRAYRAQATRHCDLSFASLELPEVGDPKIRDLEERLAARGADMRRRLADEAKRLQA